MAKFSFFKNAILIFLSIGALSAKSSETLSGDGLTVEAVCKVIKFALDKGHKISMDDLMHCHPIYEQEHPEYHTFEKLDQVISGILCHGHELDGKREFPKKDNANIYTLTSQFTSDPSKKEYTSPFYLGLHRTAYWKDIPDFMTPDTYQAMGVKNQINFFESTSDHCRSLNHSRTVKCHGIRKKRFCMGFPYLP